VIRDDVKNGKKRCDSCEYFFLNFFESKDVFLIVAFRQPSLGAFSLSFSDLEAGLWLGLAGWVAMSVDSMAHAAPFVREVVVGRHWPATFSACE
jgi:hypothetical protein